MAQQRIESALRAATDAHKVPGIAAISLDRSGNQIFKAVSGTTNISDASAALPMTSSTPAMIFSCTKLVTSVCALQLLEAGKLQLEDLAEKYIPEIADIKLIEGFNDDGSPKLRTPKAKPTLRMLMTHTAGFGYDFFDKTMLQYRLWKGEPPHAYSSGQRSLYNGPLLFEPGERPNYSVSIDWLGFVIEAITGVKLHDYVQRNILDPLGMKDSSASIASFASTGLLIHHRGEDGSLTANPTMAHPTDAETYGGGHYLYSTLDDYSTFLLTILNNGTNPRSGAQILQESTVREYLFKDQISVICSPNGIGVLESAQPLLTNEGEFFPGLKKSWSCGMMLNVDANPKGRSAGSGAWAGLSNSYYWIDHKEGKLGFIMSAVFPFFDEEVLKLFDEVERAAYGHAAGKAESFKVGK